MPLLPASLIEPLWVEFAALIGVDRRPEFVETHPWGCHRRRIPDRVVFDHLIAALVHGSGYERIATTGCSDRTLRRRLHEWAQAGHGPALLRICLAAYDRIIGLDLHELAVDGCITKAPCGGEVAGRSPVDRGKQGMKRSVASEGLRLTEGITEYPQLVVRVGWPVTRGTEFTRTPRRDLSSILTPTVVP